MHVRALVSVLCVSFATFAAAGCGDDDEPRPESRATAEGGTLKDVPPRANRPNIVGTEGLSSEQLVNEVGGDAVTYWASVFEESGLPYRRPELAAFQSPGDDGCGGQYDPAREFFHVCASGDSGQISTSERLLELFEAVGGGDAGAAFIVGFAVALDANGQLAQGGGPFANGQEPDDRFKRVAACFTGAWVRNLGDRKLLEAGDLDEVVRAGGDFFPVADETERRSIIALGHNEGVRACQVRVGGEPESAAAGRDAAGADLSGEVPPQAAAPNIARGDAPIEDLAAEYAATAVDFWGQLFQSSGVRYANPEIVVADRPATCAGTRFDPARDPYLLCADGRGSRLFFGAPMLERVRNTDGDAAAAFLAGYGVALDALDQLEDRPLAQGRRVGDAFTHGAVCMTGVWVEHITTQELVEAGDNDELLKVAEAFVPGRTELDVSLGQDLLALGVSQGPMACLDEVRS